MFVERNTDSSYLLTDSVILQDKTIIATIKKGEDGVPILVLEVDDHNIVSHLLTFTLEATEWLSWFISDGEELMYISSCGGSTRISHADRDADLIIRGPTTSVNIPDLGPFAQMIFEATDILLYHNFLAGLIEYNYNTSALNRREDDSDE